jgi:hypothetical protein
MTSEREFMSLPQDLQRFLMDLQLQEKIRDLQSRYWNEFGEASSRDLILLRQAYLEGLADGLEESQPEVLREMLVIKSSEPEKRQMIVDKTLQAVMSEYQAIDHALDRLIGLIGKVMQDFPEKREYRNRMNQILYDFNMKVSDLRGRNRE